MTYRVMYEGKSIGVIHQDHYWKVMAVVPELLASVVTVDGESVLLEVYLVDEKEEYTQQWVVVHPNEPGCVDDLSHSFVEGDESEICKACTRCGLQKTTRTYENSGKGFYDSVEYAWPSGDEDWADPGDMDGDFDSGMASAGFGTDEDYGYGGE